MISPHCIEKTLKLSTIKFQSLDPKFHQNQKEDKVLDVSITYEIAGTLELNPDRLRELKAFDNSIVGVKGLLMKGSQRSQHCFLMQRTKFTARDCWQNTESICEMGFILCYEPWNFKSCQFHFREPWNFKFIRVKITT